MVKPSLSHVRRSTKRVNIGTYLPYAKPLLFMDVCTEVNISANKKRRERQNFLKKHGAECEVCNAGGHLLCCDTCSLVFHLKCVRPRLGSFPEKAEVWSCAVCVAERKDITTQERATAKRHVRAMKELAKRAKNVWGAEAVAVAVVKAGKGTGGKGRGKASTVKTPTKATTATKETTIPNTQRRSVQANSKPRKLLPAAKRATVPKPKPSATTKIRNTSRQNTQQTQKNAQTKQITRGRVGVKKPIAKRTQKANR
eukprot:c13649_g1_i1.p1 GENE.c13649_g1_i1~~c13649_g1_i1.p1  ORF type:complete len:280 (+),score=73.68 c13649_g1_i1:77-841(+)